MRVHFISVTFHKLCYINLFLVFWFFFSFREIDSKKLFEKRVVIDNGLKFTTEFERIEGGIFTRIKDRGKRLNVLKNEINLPLLSNRAQSRSFINVSGRI